MLYLTLPASASVGPSASGRKGCKENDHIVTVHGAVARELPRDTCKQADAWLRTQTEWKRLHQSIFSKVRERLVARGHTSPSLCIAVEDLQRVARKRYFDGRSNPHWLVPKEAQYLDGRSFQPHLAVVGRIALEHKLAWCEDNLRRRVDVPEVLF